MPVELEVIILAAGKGTRMRSALPKVLHGIGGKPMLQRVYETARQLQPRTVHIVYGHGGEKVREHLASLQANWVLQAEQLGTGHAVVQAMPQIADSSRVLVLYGDVPLIEAETLRTLLDASAQGLAVLSIELENPQGYGRVVRDEAGHVQCIVEEKDATPAQRMIREVNTGLLAAPAGLLRNWLQRLDNDNAQGEYYLTDVIALAVADGVETETVMAADIGQVSGINDRLQQAELERALQHRQVRALQQAGVCFLDPLRFDLRGELQAGEDVVIDINVLIEGRVRLGDGVQIGANCILRDVEIADGTVIRPMSIIENARIGRNARIGPFARIRPDTLLDDEVHVGNFVEIKKSNVGQGSKINHLSYIGDTDMGRGVNVGAGTITCNYDGIHKHRTTIGDGVFIGSDTQLVAPVTVHDGATIGAGSTITKDAPAERLSLSRSKQVTISGWQKPVKKQGG